MPKATEPFRPDAAIVPELAAGVVLAHDTEPEVFLLHYLTEGRWGLPKGHVDPGESLAATAIRETREETGFTHITLLEELGEVSYRFFEPTRRENVYKSVVYFFATTPERNSHPEPIFDRAEWVSVANALERVPFATDRRMLSAARERLARRSVGRPGARR